MSATYGDELQTELICGSHLKASPQTNLLVIMGTRQSFRPVNNGQLDSLQSVADYMVLHIPLSVLNTCSFLQLHVAIR